MFYSENEDEDDYYYEEEEEYWRINKQNRKLSVARMKTQKCQNTARVVHRHSEACGRQQQLEVDGVSRDNWIPAPQRQTERKHRSGVTQAPSLFCNSFMLKSCAGQQGHCNLNSETEFKLKLTFKLEVWGSHTVVTMKTTAL